MALFAGFFATTTASASQENDAFAPLADAIWRPIQSSVPLPQIAIRFEYNYLIVSTPCVESGLSFQENNGTLTFNERNFSDGRLGESCKNPKPSLDEVSDIFSKASAAEIANGHPILRDKAGQPIVTLERISPNGIEFAA